MDCDEGGLLRTGTCMDGCSRPDGCDGAGIGLGDEPGIGSWILHLIHLSMFLILAHCV